MLQRCAAPPLVEIDAGAFFIPGERLLRRIDIAINLPSSCQLMVGCFVFHKALDILRRIAEK